jgi:hypothetical protein
VLQLSVLDAVPGLSLGDHVDVLGRETRSSLGGANPSHALHAACATENGEEQSGKVRTYEYTFEASDGQVMTIAVQVQDGGTWMVLTEHDEQRGFEGVLAASSGSAPCRPSGEPPRGSQRLGPLSPACVWATRAR